MVVDTCLFFCAAVRFMTAIPKLPAAAYVGRHPGGAGADGEIAPVTPCGNGDASMTAVKAKRARKCLMLAVRRV